MKDTHVKAMYKMRGGSQIKELKLIVGNIKGMPNNRNNQHKIKDISEILDGADGAALVEIAAT